MKNKIYISLIALGLVAVVGTTVGLAIGAGGGSGDSRSVPADPVQAKTTSPLAHTGQPKVDSESQGVSDDLTIEPDPDFESALRSARISIGVWKTDFSRHTVPYDEILSGGPPRDGIPPIDSPQFVTPEGASAWLDDPEPVVVLLLNGEARAYPLQILTWH